MRCSRSFLLILALSCPAAAAQEGARGPVLPGERFPSLPLSALDPGGATPRSFDLSGLLGKRPIVLVEFAIGNSGGEGVLLELQRLAAEGLGGDIAILGAIRTQGEGEVAQAAARLGAIGVTLPVIVEEQPRLSQLLGTRGTAISLIDHQGTLRVAGAGGLKQKVGAGVDMQKAIRSAAARGPVPTAERLEPYQPVDDLIGERFPDFKLKALGSGEEMALSRIVGKPQRVTALLFWHPDSAGSFQVMSGIVSGAVSYHKWIDVVSVADLKDAEEVRRAEEFVKKNAMPFPVLRDEGRRTQDRYRVGSLATVFFIGPDGIVDSVYTGANVNYVPVFSLKIRRILRVGKEYETGK